MCAMPLALKPDRLFSVHCDGTLVERETETEQLSALSAAPFGKTAASKEPWLEDKKGTDQDCGWVDGAVDYRKTDHGLGRRNLGETYLYLHRFLTFFGSSLIWVLLISVALHVLQVSKDIWLSFWIEKKPIGPGWFLICYFFVAVFSALCIIPRVRVFFHAMRGAINRIHFAAIERMFRAPASYFDLNVSSILTGIFSCDQETADHGLVESFDAILTGVFQTLAIVFFNAMVNPWFLLIIPLTVMLFYHVTELYLIVTAQVRHLGNRSVRGHVSILREVLEGAPVVRCMGLNDIIRKEYCRAMDVTNTASMIFHMAGCWVNLRLEMITVLMTTMAAFLGVFFASYINSPAFAAVAVVCCLQTSNTLLLLCRNVSALQLRFVSVEQLLELQHAPEEPLVVLPTVQEKKTVRVESQLTSGQVSSHGLPAVFPPAQKSVMKTGGDDDAGEQRLPVIELVNVSAKYAEHLSYALRNVSLAIYEKERVGIIGPSGNGKSTLFNVLLRLVDVIEGGGVYLWGTSAGLVPYPELRRLFMLVLQDPLVMRGTWRTNLLVGSDAKVPDATLWAALRAVGLDSLAASSGGLDALLLLPRGEKTGGVRLSPGQRQLLCLARAVLCRPRVFLFDELPDAGATEVRSTVERLLANELRDSTALFIAHSVRTLESLCTRVVVIDNDTVSETFEIGGRKSKDLIIKKLQSIVE